MSAKVVNVLIGMGATTNAQLFKRSFVENLRGYDQIEVGKVDIVHVKDQIAGRIAGGKYDVLICKETIGEESVGGGSIDAWKEINPHLRILLVIGDNKFGGKKLYQLYNKGYFDAIFVKDFSNPTVFADIVSNGRTAEQAFSYYGVQNNSSYQMDQMRNDTMQEEPVFEKPVEQEAGMGQEDVEYQMENDDDEVMAEEPVLEEPVEQEESVASSDYSFINEFADSSSLNTADDEDEEDYVERTEHDVLPKNREDLMQEFDQLLTDSPAPPEQAKKREIEKSEDVDSHGTMGTGQTEQVRYSGQNSIDATRKELPKERAELLKPVAIDVIKSASVLPHEGYVVTAVSNTALLVEVPEANFMAVKDQLPNLPITLITPQFIKK